MSAKSDYIVSFLGAGDRSKLEYELANKEKVTADHFQQALKEWYPEARMLLLATEEAEVKYGIAVQDFLKEHDRLLTIPDGTREEDFVQIFKVISENLPENASVRFDITHGYRSLPVLGLLSLGYLREAKKIKVKNIFYAAAHGNRGIVTDLAPFLGMLDWATATNRFIEVGDARMLARTIRSWTGSMFGDSGKEYLDLEPLAEALEGLSNALLINNPVEAGRQALNLHCFLRKLRGSLQKGHPLNLLLDKLDAQVELMAFDSEASDDAIIISKLLNIAGWYCAHEYMDKAAALIKEVVFGLGKVEAGLPLNAKNYKTKLLPDGLREVLGEIKDLRDQAMHMNIWEVTKGEEGQSYKAFRRAVRRVLVKLVEEAKRIGLRVDEFPDCA